jgi:large subunit ribosomal protein L3
MKKYILATKEKMSQIFDQNGNVVPVTVINAGPMKVMAVKTKDGKDKYDAVQFGYGEKKEKNVNKPQKKVGAFKVVKELRTSQSSTYNVGDSVDASIFEEGDKVQISGTSKGKGFQGVVKRHNFGGGSRTHGQKHSEREPGSSGPTWPQRVIKGRRMAGRMGTDTITLKNLKVVKVDKENNQLYVKGALPGRRGTLLEVTVK